MRSTADAAALIRKAWTLRRETMAAPPGDEALSLYGHGEAGATETLDHANAVRPMAILKEELGAIEEARALWRRARDFYRAAGIEAGVAESTDRLARLT